MDEPKSLGGTDTGLNPVEMVLTGLGGCLSICAGMFAKSCNVKLNNFYVDIEGDLDFRGFKGDKEVDPGFQDIRFTIHVDSDSPEENIKKLIELIEARCPVSDTLQRKMNVKGDFVID